MPQPTKPPTMSPSNWRLWCCCHPKVTPPLSSPRIHNNYSFEEFDSRNRMSISKAYRPPPRIPPSTPAPAEGNAVPAVPHRKIKFEEPISSVPRRDRASESGERRQQRPTTMLLPSSPHAEHQRMPLRLKGTRKAKDKHTMPKLIRHDTEPGKKWWQVGRGLLDGSEKDGRSQSDNSGRGERR